MVSIHQQETMQKNRQNPHDPFPQETRETHSIWSRYKSPPKKRNSKLQNLSGQSNKSNKFHIPVEVSEKEKARKPARVQSSQTFFLSLSLSLSYSYPLFPSLKTNNRTEEQRKGKKKEEIYLKKETQMKNVTESQNPLQQNQNHHKILHPLGLNQNPRFRKQKCM